MKGAIATHLYLWRNKTFFFNSYSFPFQFRKAQCWDSIIVKNFSLQMGVTDAVSWENFWGKRISKLFSLPIREVLPFSNSEPELCEMR